jgi:hypothetical protein
MFFTRAIVATAFEAPLGGRGSYARIPYRAAPLQLVGFMDKCGLASDGQGQRPAEKCDVPDSHLPALTLNPEGGDPGGQLSLNTLTLARGQPIDT